MLNKNRCGWGLVLSVVLSVLLGTAGVSGAKDTLIIGLEEKTTSLDPAKVNELVSTEIVNWVYEKLVTFEEGNYTQPVPQLAESWNLSEDGKTWTFQLRKDAAFSSGNPVNAEAVVFSFRRLLKLAGGAEWALTQFGATEEAVSAISENTVKIVLGDQYAPNLFLSCLTIFSTGILDPQVVMEHEVDGDMGSAWLEEHSAGSGQYILVERKRGERIVLQARSDHWRGQPAFKQVILRHIPEPLAQMAQLQKGEIDVAYNLQKSQMDLLRNNSEIRISSGPLFHIRFLGMNMGYEPFQHPEVRDAVRYAIDYDGIIKHIFSGNAIKIQTIIPKGVSGYNPATPYVRDLNKARQLLAAAGYPNGFKAELLCFKSSPWLDVATKLKNDLAEIQVDVQLNPMPASQAIEKWFSRDFQFYHGNWNFDYADPSGMALVFAHGASDKDDAKVKMAAWWHRYVNLETTKLTEQGMRELDHEKRAAIYQELTEILLDDGPYAMLFSLIIEQAYRADVEYGLGAPSPFTGFPTIR